MHACMIFFASHMTKWKMFLLQVGLNGLNAGLELVEKK